MSYIIEASINDEKKSDSLFFHRNTTWYPTDVKDEDSEIFRRSSFGGIRNLKAQLIFTLI